MAVDALGTRVPFRGLKSPNFPESDFKTSGLYTRCCSAGRCGVSAEKARENAVSEAHPNPPRP